MFEFTGTFIIDQRVAKKKKMEQLWGDGST